MKILILCTGNSCRSQMAHGFLQSFDSKLDVFSAGTSPVEKVNPLAVQVMNEAGIDISRHRPIHVNEFLNSHWDYVITVCSGAYASCPQFAGSVTKRLHIGFDDPAAAKGSNEEVISEFRRIRDEIKNGFAKFYITEILGREFPKCACNE